MTQNGVAYELPKQVLAIKDTESLSLPTLPTPKAQDGYKGNTQTSAEREVKGFYVDLPNVAVDLMPTPTSRDYKDGTADHQRDGKIQTDTVARAIFSSGEIMLQTPQVDDAKNTGHNQSRRITLASQVWANHETNWGKFEPAIRRWEAIIGRPAPEPTKPDGKEGNHRLSSKFTEWMMGLPDGWITGHDLKRNDELKLAGNGVVPQQAELALRLLLELPEERER
jgi:DNA (cytosine-5)-methyltransferase 1